MMNRLAFQILFAKLRAVFINDLERIDPVPERFAHLSSELIADQTVDQDVMERALPGLLVA